VAPPFAPLFGCLAGISPAARVNNDSLQVAGDTINLTFGH
jgi:hypothetical protein